MKSLYLFFGVLVIFSLSAFPNSVFGQNGKKEKNIIPYDSVIGDWNIIIPVPLGVIPNENYQIFISVNGVWNLPSEFTETGIELIHPSELFLREGEEYYFKAIFVDNNNKVKQTEALTLHAPSFNINLYWKVKDSNIETEVSISGSYLEDFVPNIEESYFSTIDDDLDSIIHGEYKKFPVSFRNSKFFGETSLKEENIATKKQYLNFSIRLDNDDGQAKLYGNELSALLLRADFELTRNLVGAEAFTSFFGDNMPKDGYLLSMNGQVIKKLILQSNEPIWLEGIPSGQYFIYVKDYKPKKIMKIN